jgi:hypothetical protein
VDKAVSTQLSILHNKVTYQYQQYQNISSYVLPRHEYLFTQRSLDYRLKMSYDSISCWLWSVEEACHILMTQQRHLQETATVIFQTFRPQPTLPEETTDSDSTYAPSNTPYTASFSLPSDSLTEWSTSSSSLISSTTSHSTCSTNSSIHLLNPVIDSADHTSDRARSSQLCQSYSDSDESSRHSL